MNEVGKDEGGSNMANGWSLSPTNKQIRDWEIDAYSERKHNRENAEKNFNQVLFYNAPFVHFLADFYDLKDKRILDYGCGLGMFCELFSNYSTAVSGCDISQEQLNFAKEKTNSSITYFQDDFFSSTLAENSYDFIFCRDLGPLQKIDYSVENINYLKKITAALRKDGIAYFILMGNLDDKPGNRLTGFQNHRLTTIYNYFSQAGCVSMINVFDYQVVVVTKKEDVAAMYNEKMYLSVKNMLENLREYDEVGYMKCKVWLFLNRGENVEFGGKDFAYVDRYVGEVIYPLLIKSLCYKSAVGYPGRIVPFTGGAPYFVSGDQDGYFEKHYERAIYATIRPVDPFLRAYMAFRQKTYGLLPVALQRRIYGLIKPR